MEAAFGDIPAVTPLYAHTLVNAKEKREKRRRNNGKTEAITAQGRRRKSKQPPLRVHETHTGALSAPSIYCRRARYDEGGAEWLARVLRKRKIK